MTGQVIVGLALGFPLALGLLARVGAPHIFFSLMAGELLGRYFGHDVDALGNQIPITGYGEALLIVIPVLTTALLLRSTVSRSKIILHIVPLALIGIIFAAFLLPVLPESIQQHVGGFYLGATLLELNKVIIGMMIILQLVSLWLLQSYESSRRRKKE